MVGEVVYFKVLTIFIFCIKLVLGCGPLIY